ncbi:TetR/AcrR family transcriptional regulator C-terminal domain-containing protein [Paenibacillus kribbensis]|uniref:TetR/AcrR family transcriptional regulator n=1 Tax=Paenibacillus kribbensis TaxID=172713 RepID=UPI002DBCD8FE|nr:TetR/AcrR family transcriptional regulator C-terminal domain-containing protein [Paenibacillus kribbensis]MEC0234010.1 TetR/AcrR family transcriptional regulator C-terminal domain-containing protein [Paenibacillus kribbensis]
MAERIHDVMTARTKKRIRDTFISLVEQYGFNAVTVRNLTATARINRGTFYLHYKDKYDVIEQIQTDFLDGLQKVMVVNISPDEMKQTYREEKPYLPFVGMFEYIHKYGSLIRLLLGPKGEPGFAGKLRDMVNRSFHKKLQNNNIFNNNPAIPQEYLSAYVAAIFLGVMEEWLSQDMPHSPEQIAVFYIKLIFLQPFK